MLAALKNELLRYFPHELYISGHVISLSKHSVPAQPRIMHVLSTKLARLSRSWFCKAPPHLPHFARGKWNKALPYRGEKEGSFLILFLSLHLKVPIILPFPLSKPLKILNRFQVLTIFLVFPTRCGSPFLRLLISPWSAFLLYRWPYSALGVPLFASPDFKFFGDTNHTISKNFLWLLKPGFSRVFT